MQGFRSLVAIACLAALSGAACSKPKAFKPERPLPAGTLLFHFTRKVEGPVDLTIDGVRIPVPRHKKAIRNLIISGLSTGQHRYFLSSPRDAFGPDRGDIQLPKDQGTYTVLFAQHFDAVLYGEPEAMSPAPGLPGVTVHVER